jgi:ribosome-associated toxin RatA of RatAB toxin-antitoxin module
MADQASQRATIGASPQELFDVVTDFDRYTSWIRDLKAVEVVARDDEGRAVEVRYRAAAMGRSTSYTLRYDYSDAP